MRVYFKEHNTIPIKDPYLLLKKISENLKNDSPFLSKVIDKMFDDNSLDLNPRKDKAKITFASYLHNFDTSFIFTNYEANHSEFNKFITINEKAVVYARMISSSGFVYSMISL